MKKTKKITILVVLILFLLGFTVCATDGNFYNNSSTIQNNSIGANTNISTNSMPNGLILNNNNAGTSFGNTQTNLTNTNTNFNTNTNTDSTLGPNTTSNLTSNNLTTNQGTNNQEALVNTNSSSNNNGLTTGDIISILLIVVGVVIILLGIAVLIRLNR